MPNEIILLSLTLLNTSRASIKVRNNWLRLKIFKYSELNIRIYRNSIVSFFKAIIQVKRKFRNPRTHLLNEKRVRFLKAAEILKKVKSYKDLDQKHTNNGAINYLKLREKYEKIKIEKVVDESFSSLVKWNYRIEVDSKTYQS